MARNPGGRDVAQLGGKIRAYNPQEAGAEFWSARRKLSHVPQVPACKHSGAAGYNLNGTGQTAIGTHVPGELTRSKRHSDVVAENGLEVPSYDDNRLGYLLPFLENNLPRRAVYPPGEADQSQEFPFIDRAKCDAVETIFSVAENDRPPLQKRRHDADRIDDHERRSPKNRRPQLFALAIVIWQGQSLAEDGQDAQLEDASRRERHEEHDVREVNQTVDPEKLINHELVHEGSRDIFRCAHARHEPARTAAGRNGT